MASLNYEEILTYTIPISGTVATSGIEIASYDLLGLEVPALDSATLTISGSIDGTTYRPVYDELGTQVLVWTASTGNRMIGAKALADLAGLHSIKIVLGSGQNTGARTFKLRRAKPNS